MLYSVWAKNMVLRNRSAVHLIPATEYALQYSRERKYVKRYVWIHSIYKRVGEKFPDDHLRPDFIHTTVYTFILYKTVLKVSKFVSDQI